MVNFRTDELPTLSKFTAVLQRYSIDLIATFNDLLVGYEEEPVRDLQARMFHRDISVAPVRSQSGETVGVYQPPAARGQAETAGSTSPKMATPPHESDESRSVGQSIYFRRLSSDILIAAEAPILDFMRNIDHEPFSLVLRHREIDGIVTLADIEKLEARPVIFGLVSAVELYLTRELLYFANRDGQRDEAQQIEFLAPLGPRRWDAKKKHEELARDGRAGDLIGATQFCDKKTLFLHHYEPSRYPSERTKKWWDRWLGRIERLRNQVAHSGTVGNFGMNSSLGEAVCAIEELLNLLEEAKPSSEPPPPSTNSPRLRIKSFPVHL